MPTNRGSAVAFTLSILLLTAASGGGASSPTAYEVLQSYDFPVGIIPKDVIGYDLDRETGRFNAYFNGSCSFALDGSYKLSYNRRISGYIHKGKLTGLSGISVKVLFLWLDIMEVRRKGDNLVFSVSVASAEFSIDNFFVSPQCGCGLNCENAKDGDENRRRGKLRSNPFVSEM